jgi:hypothetical protein
MRRKKDEINPHRRELWGMAYKKDMNHEEKQQ